MGATPQELKEEIDRTRADLAETVDALAEKVTPSPAARRTGVGAVAGLALLVGLLQLLRRRRGREA